MDMHRELRELRTVKSQLETWSPIYGRAQGGVYTYSVFWLTGNGGYSRCFKSSSREEAYVMFRKFPKGAAFIQMRDSVSDELIGEEGRNDYMQTVRALVTRAEQVTGDVAVMCGGVRIWMTRREQLLKQAGILFAACQLPGDL